MAYLVLSNGMTFEGQRIGAQGVASGEMVFTTGVVGYLETLTDPAYAGQVVVQTFPQIGNYGVISEDLEGAAAVAGYVVHELCDAPSNFRCEGTLDESLKKMGVVGISGVDTRELTRILRSSGPFTAVICDEAPADIPEADSVRAGCTETTVYPAQGEKKYAVTLVDYGVKKSVIAHLCSLGCEVKAVPQETPAAAILAEKPDGVILSPGPGDPAQMAQAIALSQLLIGKAPLLGLGLGHQLIALAMGAKTVRLPVGHRGSNHPVKALGGSRTYITSQNHGYAVCADSLPASAVMTYQNVNDHSCEGVEYPVLRCMTVQFEPDTKKSFIGTSFVYDRFIAMMGGNADA